MPSRNNPAAAPRRARVTAAGRPRASRAAQFMPFAALTGYYELARQQERVTEPKRELTEEEANGLADAIGRLERRGVARVTYYDRDAYRTITGTVARIDPIFRKLQIIHTTIDFDDLLEVTPIRVEPSCDNTDQ